MPECKVESLSGFVERVYQIRNDWRVSDHKEIWFRGESQRYRDQNTFLRPELYRPRLGPSASCGSVELKLTQDLLDIESDLYDHFKRCAVQLSDEK